ncbi:UNVERIFIED_CONTAM: hypothetical protein PYX00_010886 [Menopon gallinae]|uniref:Uncharacterized protein n=1 Tax=Menopon gallinae TaxID=328185 RepID=A0AAW2H6H7_9NEOP
MPPALAHAYMRAGRIPCMREDIESLLSNPPSFDTEEDLRLYVNRVKQKVIEYEQQLLEEGQYTEDAEQRVGEWRRRIWGVISESKRGAGRGNVSEKHSDVFETVKLASRQIDKANVNLQLLDKSTLKLVGLNYSSRDIENELAKARDVITKSRAEERREVWMVYTGVLVLATVCLVILADKLFSSWFP